MSIRRKPEFDRFMSGLSKRINSLVTDTDWDKQDLVNVTRSECSRVWKYLIEKVNKQEKEITSLEQRLAEAEDLLEDFILEDEHLPECRYKSRFGMEYDCKCMDRTYFNRDNCLIRTREYKQKYAKEER